MNLITTNATYDMVTGVLLDWEGYEHDGPVALCKGEGTAKDQLNKNNANTEKAFVNQTAIQNDIRSGINKYLSGPGEGFDPAFFASMTSQFLNQNTANFNQAGSAVRSALASRGAGGGDVPVGGDYVRGIASLEGAKANSQATGILGLNIQNSQQALANRFNSASILSGLSAQQGQNIATFQGGSNNALNQYMSAANSGFGASFMRSLGGSLGQGIGAMAQGGIGAALGGIMKPGGGASSTYTPQMGNGVSDGFSGNPSLGYT